MDTIKLSLTLLALSFFAASHSPEVLGLQATAGQASVTLAWDANPPDEGVQGYKVEVQETSSSTPQLLDVGNVTEYKVVGLKPAASYRFRVLAYSAAGESGFSAPVTGFALDGTCSTVAGSAPEVSVIVQSYDPVAKRSDPKGLLVRFDAGSSEAIVRIELDLEGDGEPAVPLSFPVGVGFDGRYVRALAFKPTINGTWPLLVSATDAVGRKASVRCAPGVSVGF